MEKCMLVNEKLGLTYVVEDFEKFDQFVKAQTVIRDNAESEIKQQVAQGNLKSPLTSIFMEQAPKREIVKRVFTQKPV